MNSTYKSARKPCDYPFLGEDGQSEYNCRYSKCDNVLGCSELKSMLKDM